MKKTRETCPDCGLAVGEAHAGGRDVSRCMNCGLQRIGCADQGEAEVWTGERPGDACCRRLGLFQAGADTPDPNRLMGTCVWDPRTKRWELPGLAVAETVTAFARWAADFGATCQRTGLAGSRGRLEKALAPMVRVALARGLGRPPLVAWAWRELATLSSEEAADAADVLARRLCELILNNLGKNEKSNVQL